MLISKQNINFKQLNKKNEKKNPYETLNKDFPNAKNTDFAASFAIGGAFLSSNELIFQDIKLKKAALLIGITTALLTSGIYLDSFIGNKIKEKYKKNEKKGNNVQLGYDVGIASIMFPATLNLFNKTNIYKIKLLDENFLKDKKISKNKMLSGFALIGSLIGLGVNQFSNKINSWTSKNLMGYKQD